MVKMAHFFREHDRQVKAERDNRQAYYMPILDHMGAIYRRPGVWQYGPWNCYPRHGYAASVKDPKHKAPLHKILGVQREPDIKQPNY